jgi:hypothetical protein
MTVRAKFKVQRVECMEHMRRAGKTADGTVRYERGELRTIVLAPVYSNDPASENAKFWAATPSGEIKLGTINEQAWGYFELGQEYYIDFVRASDVP